MTIGLLMTTSDVPSYIMSPSIGKHALSYRFWPISSLLSMLLISSGLLSACHKNTASSDGQTASAAASQAAASQVAAQTANKGASDHRPVQYPIVQWQQTPAPTGLTVKNIDALKVLIGPIKRTDKEFLDYFSNPAIKYSAADLAVPPFDIIDSAHFVELDWYYASPSDPNSQKQQSIDYAAKVYQIARGWFGEPGGVLVADMLSGKVLRNYPIRNTTIEVAKCEHFTCMLVVKK